MKVAQIKITMNKAQIKIIQVPSGSQNSLIFEGVFLFGYSDDFSVFCLNFLKLKEGAKNHELSCNFILFNG